VVRGFVFLFLFSFGFSFEDSISMAKRNGVGTFSVQALEV
jgi:hypothetical protein